MHRTWQSYDLMNLYELHDGICRAVYGSLVNDSNGF